MCKRSIDDIDRETVRKDIRLYVGQSLVDHTWDAEGWQVKDQDADEITSRADGLFIFAATAVRYVLARSSDHHPQKSVDRLLEGVHLSQLHDLYLQIVEDAIGIPVDDDERFERTRRVLGTIVDLVEPQDIESLAGLLDINVQELQRTLIRLSAVVYGPEDAGVIKIIHLSFREFLSGGIGVKHPGLLCGTEVQRRCLTLDSFRVMQKDLKFNICDLPTSHLRNIDIEDLEERRQKYIRPHLAYSCRFWANHLATVGYSPEIGQIAGKFILDYFLSWLEVLSLLGTVSSAVQALSTLIEWSDDVSLQS
jgi:hypothetical protein